MTATPVVPIGRRANRHTVGVWGWSARSPGRLDHWPHQSGPEITPGPGRHGGVHCRGNRLAQLPDENSRESGRQTPGQLVRDVVALLKCSDVAMSKLSWFDVNTCGGSHDHPVVIWSETLTVQGESDVPLNVRMPRGSVQRTDSNMEEGMRSANTNSRRSNRPGSTSPAGSVADLDPMTRGLKEAGESPAQAVAWMLQTLTR